MSKTRFTFNMLVVCSLLVFGASLANAQATRTWVSGVGDDVNPCSRTAPCKTFAGAISKTFINGEIDVLDPGSFGGLTITKSLTVDGSKMFAGVLASGFTGFTINLTDMSGNDPNKIVRLRGIRVNGAGASGTVGTRTGIRGINISSSNPAQPRVILEDMVIDGFANEGILFASNGGNLTISNSTITNNGTAGVRADSAGANTNFVTITNSRLDQNVQEGLRVEDRVKATMTSSSASSNGLNGVTNISSAAASEVNVDNSTIANNGQNGVISVNATSTIRISGNEITNNVTNGLSLSGGGFICSNTHNHITTPTQASNCAFTDQ
jgi:hypothetical protein